MDTSSKAFLAVTLIAMAMGDVRAQTLPSGVIDVPPTAIGDNRSATSDTIINVQEGGVVGKNLRLGDADGTSTNIELNILGGKVGLNASLPTDGGFFANGGSVVNISGGEVGANALANAGSEVSVTGGTVRQGFKANAGSLVEISGGRILWGFNANAGSVVNISGGIVGTEDSLSQWTFRAHSGSQVNIIGGQFGPNFSAYGGSQVRISGGDFGNDFEARSQSDVRISGGRFGKGFRGNSGTTIVGSDFRLNGVPLVGPLTTWNAGDTLSGTLADGSVFVFSRSVNDFLSNIAFEAAPLSAPDTTPVVVDSDSGPVGLRPGQTLTLVEGGALIDRFAAAYATLNVEGGVVGTDVEIIGTQMNVTGGTVGGLLTLYKGSELNISGGIVGSGLFVYDGAEVNISGGEVGSSLSARSGSVVNITGGTIGSLSAQGGSAVDISGGHIANNITAAAGSTVSVSGGSFGRNFRANAGSVVSLSGGEFELNGTPINSPTVTLGSSDVFTGTLANGFPFLLSPLAGDTVVDVQLVETALPTIEHIPRIVDDFTPIRGLRAGETLILESGGQLPEGFAVVKGTLRVEGGNAGSFLEAAGAEIHLQSGKVGESAAFYAGSVVQVSGGEIGSLAKLRGASLIDISAGSIGDDFQVIEGSEITLSGGTVGNRFSIGGSSVVNITGGEVLEYMSANSGSTVNLEGGAIGRQFQAHSGSQINISGGSVGHSFRARSGATVVIEGGAIGGNFIADAGSEITVLGGSLNNFTTQSVLEVAGGEFNVFTAGAGSEVNISEGAFNVSFTAKDGGIIDISGGTFDRRFSVESGALVTITGGEFGLYATSNPLAYSLTAPTGRVNIHGGWFGEQINLVGDGLFGNHFELNGDPYTDPTITLRDGDVFSGVLESGAVFMFSRERGDRLNTVQLIRTSVPDPQTEPTRIDGTISSRAMREGESLTLVEGGLLKGRFVALGGTLTIEDGVAGIPTDYYASPDGNDLRFSAANLRITGGQVRVPVRTFAGTSVEISGGVLEQSLILSESTAQIIGGGLSEVVARQGSVVTLDGGTVTGLAVAADAEVAISGGSVGGRATIAGNLVMTAGSLNSSLVVEQGGAVTLSGGQIASSVRVHPGGRANISAGTYRDWFWAEAGSDVRLIGGEFRLNGDEYTGALIDLHAILDINATFTGTLQDGTPFIFSPRNSDRLYAVKLVEASLPSIDTTPIILSNSSSPPGLRTGQSLTVVDGGVVSKDFAAVDATLSVAGGFVESGLEVANSQVHISGGRLGSGFTAFEGSMVHLTGGQISVWGLSISHDSRLHISGGEFFYNGTPAPSTIDTWGSGDVLAGTLQDGTPFIYAHDLGHLLNNVELEHTSVPQLDLTPLVVNSVDGLSGLRPGQALTLVEGGQLSDAFVMVNSTLHVRGGEVTRSLTAYDSQVNITSGSIGHNLSLYYGSELNASGGVVDGSVDVWEGSAVKIGGQGEVRSLFMREGSVADISGNMPESMTFLAGSQLNLLGSSFVVGANTNSPLPLDFLEIGGSYVIEGRPGTLTGVLADGSTFSIRLDPPGVGNPNIHVGASVTVTLTPLAGDYNGDNIVDAADYTVWRNSLGMTDIPRFSGADGNGDGQITVADYEVWKLHFGNSLPSGIASLATTVPEPANMALLVALAALIAVGGAWRRSTAVRPRGRYSSLARQRITTPA